MDDDELREWFAAIARGMMSLSEEIRLLRQDLEEDDDDGEEEDLS